MSLHCRDHAVGEAAGLEGDEVVRSGAVTAGLELDGLDEQIVAETGFSHAQNVVIAEQMHACDVGGGLQGAVAGVAGLSSGVGREAEQGGRNKGAENPAAAWRCHAPDGNTVRRKRVHTVLDEESRVDG